MNRNTQALGFVLIAVGLFLFLLKVGIFPFTLATLWPAFLLVPGLLFHFFAFTTKQVGLFVPGGILTTYGLLFFTTEFFSYDWMQYLWPFFILGPAIGLFEFYLFGGRQSGVLFASMILMIIGGTFLFFTLFSTFIPYLIGLLLILVGFYFLFGNRNKNKIDF